VADGGEPLTWQDKVKVMKSRSHVTKVHAGVQEKQNTVERHRF